ncbi:MAG: thiamine pyrophosphate-binding protein [Gemmatimonadota bacterium]|nr:thiamine pyrophosphate-binding protein [Gemmatimonadota bacterium]
MTGAEAIVAVLEDAGVEVVFGLCGDTSLPFYDALARSDVIEHVLTRDERSASYMADAYARLSGRVGICEGPSGGGATYIVPGVAEANGSSVPVVCLTSDVGVEDRGKGTLTEMDQRALFASLTRAAFDPGSADRMAEDVRDAFTVATGGSLGACHVSLPLDLQSASAGTRPVATSDRYPRERPEPDPEAITQAAKVLCESRRPVIVAGAGVLRSGAWDSITRLAETLGAAVATSICGKGAIPETHPLSLGVIGSNGGLSWRHDLVRDADVVFYVGGGTGSVTTEKWSLPPAGSATVLQLDTDHDRLGRNHDLAAGLLGDARVGLDSLIEAVNREGGGGAGSRFDPEAIRAGKARHRGRTEELFASPEVPIRPERLMSELFDALPPRSVVLADPGTPCPYVSAYWELPEAGRWFVSPRAFGALGYALPAVVGAWYARPDAGQIVGVMGDGSFGISVGELETLVRLQVPAVLIVCNNAGYGWIKAGQKSRGDRYHAVDFGRSDHAAIARAYGMEAVRVEDPAELEGALRAAIGHAGPCLVDVVTQPLEEARAPVSKWIA